MRVHEKKKKVDTGVEIKKASRGELSFKNILHV